MAQPLDDQQIDTGLANLPGWRRDGDALTKTFRCKHFREAFSFLTRLAFECEEHNHHADIHNVYHTVTLRLSTHDAGDRITQKDLDLAKAIEHFNWLKQ